MNATSESILGANPTADVAGESLGYRLWAYANHLAAYCLLNLLDDPALLAVAFC